MKKNQLIKKAVVIGAGIGGIAAAIRLKCKGYEVIVLEKNAYPGGKLSEISQNGFRFDAGPSLFTMPHFVDELFTLANKNPRDYLNYKKLDETCNYFFADGSTLTAFADLEKFGKEVEEKTLDNSKTLKNFFTKSKAIFEITYPVFLTKSLHKIKTYLNLTTLLSLLRINEINAFKSMNEANKQLFKDPKMVQYFNRYATYNGSNPFKAPATLNVIPHLEHYYGAYFPIGGMVNITKSLVKLANEIGVKFSMNCEVKSVSVENKKIKGVQLENEFIPADLVVVNADVHSFYKNLMPENKIPNKLIKQEPSGSALIFYWGIKKEFPELSLHNIFFSTDYNQEFEKIFNEKTISHDPTIYLNISSKLNKEDAPDGSENWFTMINVPYNSGQNWEELIKEARKNIIEKLNETLQIDLESLIVSEMILDPILIESKTSSNKGALYGGSSNNRFAAFLRHSNFSSEVKGLYFCGGSVHPGGGIPLALLSAKITTDLIA